MMTEEEVTILSWQRLAPKLSIKTLTYFEQWWENESDAYLCLYFMRRAF